MKLYSYFDGKTQFSQIFLGSVYFLFFLRGGGGGGGGGSGGQINASFTCGQRYSMAILCTSHLYPLPPPPTSIGGDNDFSKPCPVLWGQADANNPALSPTLHNKELNP